MLMLEKKDPKNLFVGLLPHLTSKKRVNAAAWHQLHSQGDYHDPLMDVEHSSTFPKRQQSAGSAGDGTGLVSSPALCLVKLWVAI